MRGGKGSPLPSSVVNSLHKKRKFDTLRMPEQPEKAMYSKSDLLRMILENEHKQGILAKASPIINVTEAIHGTYKTNFEMPRSKALKAGLPLGTINDSPNAKQAIFAREQSHNSI